MSMPTLNRQLNLAVQGECTAQKRFSEAEEEMDIRNWEPQNGDSALHETNRELESQRLELHQANQWADQAQTEKINVWRTGNEKQKSSKKIVQETAKKSRNYEESVAKKERESQTLEN